MANFWEKDPEVEVGGDFWAKDLPVGERVVPIESEPPEATVTGEAIKGFKRYGSSARTGLETFTGDPEEAVRAGMKRQEEFIQQYGQARGLEEFKKAYGEGNYLAAGKEFLSQIPTAVAGQAGTLATMAGFGRVGAVVGTKFLPGIGTVAGGTIGAGLGAIISQLKPFYEENLIAQLRAQEERGEPVDLDRAKAAATAVMQSSAEVGGAVLAFGRRIIGGIIGSKTGDEAKEALVKAAQRSLLGSSTVGAGRAVATEIPVELAQNILTRAQAGESLTDDDAFEDYKNTIYETIKVAGPLGAGAGPINRASARGRLDEINQLEQYKKDLAEGKTTPEQKPVTDLTPEEQAELAALLAPAVERVVTPESEIDEIDAAKGAQEQATWDNMQPGQQITLYRGENASNDANGQWWTTDRSKAEKYGDVTEVTLPSEIIGMNAARGDKSNNEFVFTNKRPSDLVGVNKVQGEQDATTAPIVGGVGVSPEVSGQPGGVPAGGAVGVDGARVDIAGDTSQQAQGTTAGQPGTVTPPVQETTPTPVQEITPATPAPIQEITPAPVQETTSATTPAPIKTETDTGLDVAAEQKIAKPIKYVEGYTPTTEPSANNFLNQNSLYGKEAPLTPERGVDMAAADQAFDMVDSVSYGKLANILKKLARQENQARDTDTFSFERPLEFMSLNDLLNLYRENIGTRKNFKEGGAERIKAARNRAAFIESLTPEQRAKYDAALDRMFADTVRAEGTGRREATESDLRKQKEKQEKQVGKQKAQAITDVQEQVAEANKTDEQIEAEERAEAEAFAKQQETETEQKAVKEATTEAKEKKVSTRDKRIQSAINDSGDIKSVLDELAGGEVTPVSVLAKKLAGLFKNLGITDPTAKRIRFGKVEGNNDGKFMPDKNAIVISGVDGKYTGQRDLGEVVLHEIMHYYTDHVIDNRTTYINGLDPEFRAEAKAALNRLNINFKRAKAALGKEFDIPTIKEYIAETFSNPRFQQALKRLDESGKEYKAATKDSMFKAFVKNIAAALGLTEKTSGVTLKETLEDVANILSVPSPSTGMTGKSVSYAGTKPTTKKADEVPKVYKTVLDLNNPDPEFALEKTGGLEPKPKLFRGGLQGMFRRWQNDKQPTRLVEEQLISSGQANFEGDGINTPYTAYVLSSGNAVILAKEQVTPATERLHKAFNDLIKKTGWDRKTALEKLHMITAAMHEGERRQVKYLMQVPLNNDGKYTLTQGGKQITPADRRNQIVNILETRKLSKEQAQQLRAELESIVEKYKDPLGYSPRREKSETDTAITGPMSVDPNGAEYVVTGMSPESAAAIKQQYEAFDPEVKGMIDSIRSNVSQLNDATRNLNSESGFWSAPVNNFANFYGWENYVPFKTSLSQDERLNYDSKRLGGDLQDTTQGFDGSFEVSDNPILRTMSDAFRAAARAGRKDYILAIKNAVKQKHISGDIKTIKFEDRNTDLPLAKKQNTIFHYNQDGSVDVISIKDPVMLNSLRRMYKERQPLVEMMNRVTSFLGQTHTRYNYAFGPMNFVRDILTNSFVLGSDFSPREAARFIGAVSAKVSQNGLMKAAKIAHMFEKNDVAGIKKLLNDKNADAFSRQIAEYLSNGGMISYTESLSLKSRFEALEKELGQKGLKNKVITTKEGLDKFVDIWNNMFELTSRSAAYGVVKQRVMNKEGLSDTAAQKRAAAYVKNLANFELAGEYGRVMGALFMFFRPAATGAVRAIEAVTPAFQSVDSAIRQLPPSIRNNPEALAKFKATFNKRRTSARIMMATLMSTGYGMYMMSAMMAPEDELERNSVLNDNMAQWSRYARFHIPNEVSEKYLGGAKNVVFQIPWGFGLGAFAAAGAQVAGAMFGKGDTKELLKNVFTDIALDSFIPIPVSRMDFEESPMNFIIDSMMPSFARPVVQFALNKDGLGRGIYNESYRRMVDAYTGGDRIPEIWKDAARYIIEATDGKLDLSPNALYFLTNSYIDGFSRVFETAYGVKSIGSGEKDFNPKTDLVLFNSFFGAKGNVDNKEFAEMQQKMLKKQNILNGFKESNPAKYMEYVQENPMDQPLVDAFNKLINGDLRKLQSEAKKIRSAPTEMLTPKERKEMLEPNLLMQRLIKRSILDMFNAYEGKG